jgi:hypothetical protein
MMNVNLKGTPYASQICGKFMIDRRYGRIVFEASSFTIRPLVTVDGGYIASGVN